MTIKFVSRQSIIDNLLDRINAGEMLSMEMKKLLSDMVNYDGD